MTKAKARPVRTKRKAPARPKPPKLAAPKPIIPDSCRVIGRFVPGFHDY